MYTFFCLRNTDSRIKVPDRRNYCLHIMLKTMHHLAILRDGYVTTPVPSEQIADSSDDRQSISKQQQ